jgi:hypothetical protein
MSAGTLSRASSWCFMSHTCRVNSAGKLAPRTRVIRGTARASKQGSKLSRANRRVLRGIQHNSASARRAHKQLHRRNLDNLACTFLLASTWQGLPKSQSQVLHSQAAFRQLTRRWRTFTRTRKDDCTALEP